MVEQLGEEIDWGDMGGEITVDSSTTSGLLGHQLPPSWMFIVLAIASIKR